MLDFFAHLWFWLLASFSTGMLAGALTRSAPRRGSVARWLIWSALAFAVGLVVAGLGVLQGAAGANLESALGCFSAFLAGAAAGACAAHHTLRGHEGWAIGLLPAALIWLAATQFGAPAFERDLTRRVGEVAARNGVDASDIKVAGRDLSAPAKFASNARLIDELSAIKGVRLLLTKSDSDKVAAPPATPPPPATTATIEKPPAADEQPVSETKSPGELSAAQCEAELNAERVEFCEGSAAIYRRAARTLDRAAAIIRRCPETPIEVIGRADNIGDELANEELSWRRAAAVARYLRREGLAGRKVIAVGVGASRPLAPNDDAEGRARNRSVSFSVKPAI